MVLAYIFLNESIAIHSIVGAAVILAGTECVRRGNRDNLASLAAKAAFIPIGGRAPEHTN
jgi:drug/metabolite transporter (DMT)-like permease